MKVQVTFGGKPLIELSGDVAGMEGKVQEAVRAERQRIVQKLRDVWDGMSAGEDSSAVRNLISELEDQ